MRPEGPWQRQAAALSDSIVLFKLWPAQALTRLLPICCASGDDMPVLLLPPGAPLAGLHLPLAHFQL